MKREDGYRDAVSLDDVDLDTVELERTTDPMRAAMVRNILEGADIVVSTPGYNVVAMVGVMGLDISIRVPKLDLDRAREALRERGALSSKITVKSPRRWQLAMWVALVPSFGCGHAHAGAYASAGLLCFAEVVALTAASRHQIVLAGVAALFPIVADFWGSRSACARANASEPTRLWVSPAAMLAAVMVPAYLVLMSICGGPLFAGPDGRMMCEMFARCGPEDEDQCLVDYPQAELTGGNVYSRACLTCVREEHACDGVVDACVDLCRLR